MPLPYSKKPIVTSHSMPKTLLVVGRGARRPNWALRGGRGWRTKNPPNDGKQKAELRQIPMPSQGSAIGGDAVAQMALFVDG